MDDGPVTVMLVDDDPGSRALVATLLEGGPFRVQAADLESWSEDVEAVCPGVLLLDLALPGGQSAVEQIPRIVAACPTTMVAVLTSAPPEELEPSVLRAGAFVFYEKDTVGRLPDFVVEDLAKFHRALAGEEAVAPSALTRRRTSSPSSVPSERANE